MQVRYLDVMDIILNQINLKALFFPVFVLSEFHFPSFPSLLWCLKLASKCKPEIVLCKRLSSAGVGGFSEGVVPPNPPPSTLQTCSEKPLSCTAEWTETRRNEGDRMTEKKISIGPLLYFFSPKRPSIHPSSYTFFSSPSFFPSLPLLRRSCRGMPLSPPTSIVQGRARGQEEGGGGKQRSTVAVSLGFLGSC